MSTRTDEDLIDYLFVASTHSYILIFTDTGKVHWLKVWRIPEVGTSGRGKPIINLIGVSQEERIADMLAVQDLEGSGFVFMASRKGYAKKTPIRAFSNPRSAGIIACSVDDRDELVTVALAEEGEDVLIFTRRGKAIRFPGGDVRAMGRTARGVRGIRTRGDDYLIGMDIVSDSMEDSDLLTVTQNGYGKRTPIAEYRRQGRGGLGVININTSERNGPVINSCLVEADSEIVIITENGKIIRLQVDRIRQTVSRNAQGVRLIDLEENDRVADVSTVPPEEEEGEEPEPETSE